jgi:hypothetical protein
MAAFVNCVIESSPACADLAASENSGREIVVPSAPMLTRGDAAVLAVFPVDLRDTTRDEAREPPAVD